MMTSQKFRSLVMLLILGYFLTGCIAWERSVYNLELKHDGSVDGSVTFVNMLTDKADGEDDYKELLDDFLHGEKSVLDFPVQNERREIYEHQGQLWGIIRFELKDLSQAGFLRDPVDSKAAWLLPWTEGVPATDAGNGQWLEPEYHVEMLRWPAQTIQFHWEIPGETAHKDQSLYSLLPYFLAEEAQ